MQKRLSESSRRQIISQWLNKSWEWFCVIRRTANGNRFGISGGGEWNYILISYRRIHFPFFYAAAGRWHIGHWQIIDALTISFADAATNLNPEKDLTIITFDLVIVIWHMSGKGMISDKTKNGNKWLWNHEETRIGYRDSDSDRNGMKQLLKTEYANWISYELTDNMRWMATWNATNATSIQLNQCGSSALLNEIAKKMVTTATMKKGEIKLNLHCHTRHLSSYTYKHRCVRHFRRANATNWISAVLVMSEPAAVEHQTVARNTQLSSPFLLSHADYLRLTIRQVQ